uniref:Otopetrin-2 n=1 Tax=Globodera pallida TaxID=36090 RepID=A0A183C172_GLOPA
MPSASPLPSLAPSNSPYKVAIKIRQRSADMGAQFEEHRPNTFSLNSNIHPFQPPKKCLSSVPSSLAEASGSPPPSLPPSPPIPRSNVRQRDVPVPAECSSAPSWGSEREQSWFDNPSAWDHFCSVLTSLYALFIIVFAVVVELSQKFTPDEWFSETLFYTYMYGAGIVFLMYCYLFKVHPNWISRLVKFARKKEIIRKSAVIVNRFEVSKTGQVRRGTGSLYLRLGTLCFGSSGIVLFCLEVFICFSDRACFNYQLVNWLFAGLFTFIQMHFIFCNSKLIIVDSKNSAKLGTMHLLAVNIWTWLRFVIAKNAALDRPLDRRRESLTSGESSEGMGQYQQHTQMLDVTYNPSASLERIVVNRLPSKVYSFNYFGDFATLLTTCIVEYSVIGAAVMVCLWRSIDEQNAKIEEKCSETMALKQHKNGKSVRIDCSASNGGLFAGLLFLIAALVSIGIHSFFSQLADSDGALLVFRLSDMALFCCTLIGCSVGLLRMRSLQYHCHEEQRSSSTEFLDEILLIIGLVGELIHSSTGVMCWIATLSDRRVPVKMELYMLFVFITRIVQVVVQAVFILLARRLCALSDRARKDKPGKQFVTFLLIANVSLFFFHTLEGMKSVFGSTIATRRARPYASLIVGVSPLVVFYRFHSRSITIV